LHAYEWEDAEIPNSFAAGGINRWEHRFGSDNRYDEDARMWLDNVQSTQDAGAPWSEAIESADKWVGRA
jgi:hypothetical protein